MNDPENINCNLTKILQIHLYWQVNGISFKTIYETYEKMVHANDQLADITVEEIFSYLNDDYSPQLNFNNSDYEKLEWLLFPSTW
ncbi:MAG: hypothetical protein ACOCXD_01340 [Bacteroidota bacterium]